MTTVTDGAPLTVLLDAVGTAIDRRAAASWPETEQARTALTAVHADLRALHADPFADRPDLLAHRAGWTAASTRVLVAAAAADLTPALHVVMGLLSGDPGPGRPTVATALELAGLSPLTAAGRSVLTGLSPLRRHGLVHLDGTGVHLSRRVAVPDTVVDALLGSLAPPADLLRVLNEPTPVRLPGTDAVAAALRDDHSLIWVHSPPGTAGIALAAAACRDLDVPYLHGDLRRLPVADGTAGPSPESVRRAVDGLLLHALLTGSVLILSGAELAAPVTDRLAGPALPVIAVGSTPWDPIWTPEELPVSVLAPRVSPKIRAALWGPMFPGAHPDPQVTALRLTPEEVNRVAHLARATARIETAANGELNPPTDNGEAPVDTRQIRRATQRLGRNRSSKFAASAEPATMDDLALPDHTKSEVQRLLDWARYRDEVLAQGPLQGKGGKGTGICALFAGGPGTGKSLAAHVVADTLGMDLYSVDVSSMVDKYVGETEKNLQRVFTEAESLNAVLFFDEADSLFGSRSEVRDSRDRYANQEVAFLLQRMEQFDGITVLATNLRGNLDPAFSRRLHFVIHFPDPDELTRCRLWGYHLSHLAGTDAADPIDTAVLARDLDLAGGEIRNVVLSAAYQAASEQGEVGMRHITAAAHREYTKLGRRVPVLSAATADPRHAVES